ncbi:MAG: hypothetical protein V4727_06690 [Verrucomicrobiota bacterium]
MKALIITLLCFVSVAAHATEFRHIGDFLLQSHFKVTESGVTPIPMKPVAFKVFTDGITVRINLMEDEKEAFTSFEIYRSDGISRQRSESGAIEVIPGIQASSNSGGILRHLRLTQESFTLTTFPGVSDQTIISHAVAATSKDSESDKKP